MATDWRGNLMPMISPLRMWEKWLAQKVSTRDARAFGQLYDAYAPRVFGLLRRLCHSADEAEDLTQETFLAAPEALRTWRGESALSTFLCGIAYRKWARARRDEKHALPLHDVSEIADTGSDPIAHLSQQELSQALEAAIATLPADLRAVFVLVRVEEMAYRDAAVILDVPLGTVQSRLHRAHQLLRLTLSQTAPDFVPGTTSDAPARLLSTPREKGATAHVLD